MSNNMNENLLVDPENDDEIVSDPEPEQARYGAGDLDDSVVAEEHVQESIQKLKGKLKEA